MKKTLTSVSVIAGLCAGMVCSAFAGPVESGLGKTKVSGLLQIHYTYDNGANPMNMFRFRRAEVKVSGEINPKILWNVTIDPAQVNEDVTRKSPLQDAGVTLKHCKYMALDLGQFKVPFGMEGLDSSARLDFAERAALSSVFKWSEGRDLGMMLRSDFKIGDVKIMPFLGIFNGEGQNRADLNNGKDIAARLVAMPITALQIGVSHYNGKTGAAEAENTHTAGEIRYIMDPISLYGEYATGKAGTTNKLTYYASAAYKINDIFSVAARYDFYDANSDTSGNALADITGGINYIIDGLTKLQLNYVSRSEESLSVSNDIFRCNLQVTY